MSGKTRISQRPVETTTVNQPPRVTAGVTSARTPNKANWKGTVMRAKHRGLASAVAGIVILLSLQGSQAAAAEQVSLGGAAKAAPIIQRLEAAVREGDRFAAEDLLAEVEKLTLKDARIAGIRQSVAALPWPKAHVFHLGGGVKMELVLIPAGSFTMGDDTEEPAHKVTITKSFYMGKYEVTQAQWEAVMGQNPSRYRKFKKVNNPVEQVSWEACQAFLKKLDEKFGKFAVKFRLPTEAQWEYACRAGSTSKYSFGDQGSDLGEYGWFEGNSLVVGFGRCPHPVGEKKPNAWGLYDMHGNVSEWCADWYDGGYYKESPPDDPSGPSSGSSRVVRGGSSGDFALDCHSAFRFCLWPASEIYICGLRVVCVVDSSR
jgi:formylglycine-generating enzyme required for sulfatase activity